MMDAQSLLVRTAVGMIGGWFAIMVFIHFFSDWLFQSHAEAKAKSSDNKVRSKHCLIYTVFFLPFFVIMGVPIFWQVIFALILFFSHYIEDTYIPVMWWFKHIRKVPYFASPLLKDDPIIEQWKSFATAEPALSFILLITVDQIVHIFFLFLIAIMMYYV